MNPTKIIITGLLICIGVMSVTPALHASERRFLNAISSKLTDKTLEEILLIALNYKYITVPCVGVAALGISAFKHFKQIKQAGKSDQRIQEQLRILEQQTANLEYEYELYKDEDGTSAQTINRNKKLINIFKSNLLNAARVSNDPIRAIY